MLTDLFQRRARYEVVGPPSDDLSKTVFGVEESHAGVDVTPWSALTLSTVYACISAIANQMAALPLLVYRRDGRKRVRATDRPEFQLLHKRANPRMSAFTWKQTMFGHVLGWGNAWSEKEYDSQMRVVNLWPIRPDRFQRFRTVNGHLVVDFTLPNGGEVTLEYWRLHHVRGLGADGYLGYSPVALAMQSIGLALAAEEYGARFFSNDARPGVVLKHPGQLKTQEAKDRLLASWRNEAGGLSNAHRTRLLEDGMDLLTIGIPPNEAQFLETRQFQTAQIASWFGVPPSIIGDMERATWSNSEQAALNFKTFCLRPWASNHEAQLVMDVLPSDGSLDVEYLFDDFLRGDSGVRWASYEVGQRVGALSVNEIRAFEGLDPIENGDEHYLPSNMGRLDEEGNILTPLSAKLPIAESAEEAESAENSEGQGQGPRAEGRGDEEEQRTSPRPSPEEREHGTSPRPSPEGEGEKRAAIERRQVRSQARRKSTVDAYRETLAEIYGRTVRKEVRDIRAQLPTIERSLSEFVDWLTDYYRELSPFMVRSLLPVLRALMVAIIDQAADELDKESVGLTEAFEAWVQGYADNYAREWGNDSLAELQAAAEEALGADGDPVQAVEQHLGYWEEQKAATQSNAESVNAANAMAVAAYEGYRVERLRWRTNAGACEICSPLDGKVVGIREFFAQPGDTLGGATMKKRKRHPPLHGGCNCHVEAEQ